MTTVEQGPAETVAVSREVAEFVTVRLREVLEEARGLLLGAYRGRVWEPLGYAGWLDYLACEFPGDALTVALPESVRRVAESRWRQAVALVRRQGGRGLTCLELEDETGWGHGVASGALHNAERKGAVRRVEEFRRGYAAYVVAEWETSAE